jgi:hypothetical protein
MATSQEKKSKATVNDSAEPDKIDRTAPAGSKHSLGAESVRDGRPVTDDSVVEAIDEEGPGISPFTPDKKGDSGR